MKRLEYALLIMAFSAALIIPATAQTEEFKSLEFGFSAEYPREMDIDLLPQDVTSGVEDPVVEFTSFGVMTILVGASEKKGLSLERFSSRAESDYEASCENFEVMRSAVGDVNGVGSLEKEYLLEDESTAVLMRDVFLNGDDLIYHISCRAEQSSYRRADLLYFNSFIDSFKVFPIEEAVSGDWIQTAKPIWSSPALADLDGDGELEIVVGSNEGKLYVFNRDGSTVPGFPTTAEEPIRSSPPSPTWTATVSSMLSSDPTTTCSTPGTAWADTFPAFRGSPPTTSDRPQPSETSTAMAARRSWWGLTIGAYTPSTATDLLYAAFR